MPPPTTRTASDAGRQFTDLGKPKKKGKSTVPVTNGHQSPAGGAYSDNPTFSDSTVPVAPSPSPSPKPRTAASRRAKSRAIAKAKKKKTKNTTSVFDRIVQLILLGFILFTIQQCHNDTELKSPICQAVHQRILQPFVYKPYNLIATHPSVVPAIQASKPYYDQVVRLSRPVVRVVHKAYVMRVAPHVARIKKKSRPYVRNLQLHYARSLAPHVLTAQIYYARLQRAVESYVNQAIAAIIRLLFEIQPKLTRLIEASKFILEWVWEHALIPLMRLREEYVDRHVYKMMEKVGEFGESRDTKNLKSNNHITRATSVQSSSSAFQTSAPGTDTAHGVKSTPAPATIEIEPIAVPMTAAAITPEGPIIPDGPIIPPGPIIPDGPIIPQGPIIPDGPVIPDAPSPTPSSPKSTEEDLDAWLDALRAETSPSPATPEPESQLWVEETEEEIAERKRLRAVETAKKRADIESRHAKFERQIQSLGKSAVDELKIFLSAVRNVAAADLGRRAQEHIATIQNEAENGLKGTEAYLNKLKGDAQGDAVKIALFDDVVSKVEQRFLDTAQSISQTISSWSSEMYEEEQKEANTAAEAVRSLALEGQTNIGMDYAWLDDVTVADWTRYHGLLDAARAFAKELQDLVDDTHPNSEPNPLGNGLEELQQKLNTLVEDFQSKLKVLYDSGLRSFGNVNPELKESSESNEVTSSNLPDAEARSDSSAGILQRDKEEVEATSKRGEAEAGTSAENTHVSFEGAKQASDAVHQPALTIVKAADGTSTPETFQETVDYASA